MRWLGVVAISVVVLMAGCSSGSHTSSPTASTTPTTAPNTPPSFGVQAARQPLTTDARSIVAHDTELLALVPHAGELFAATGQWMYPGKPATGQVLVKPSASAPWSVFEYTQQLRVEALDSFPIPADQGMGAGHALLVTQAIIDGRSQVQWLVDRAPAFTPNNAFALAANGDDVRAFGSHEDHGVWSVYAGVAPTGILRGTWSPQTHTLLFDPTPELTAPAPSAAGQKSQKVTGFADCGGSLFVTIGTRMYRRNDGALPAGGDRWSLVYTAPPVGAFNSGIRGISCITHAGAPALLASTEGNGDVFRFDNVNAPHLTPTLEWSPIPAITQMLDTHGTPVPTRGKSHVTYVIAAYNNFTQTAPNQQAFGFEWGYLQQCPSTRTCGPTALGASVFDAAACFAVRNDNGAQPTYTTHCLAGPDFMPPGATGKPIRGGQAFVSIRTMQPSPFGDNELYFGGYDCNFYPADGTAWVAAAPARAAL